MLLDSYWIPFIELHGLVYLFFVTISHITLHGNYNTVHCFFAAQRPYSLPPPPQSLLSKGISVSFQFSSQCSTAYWTALLFLNHILRLLFRLLRHKSPLSFQHLQTVSLLVAIPIIILWLHPMLTACLTTKITTTTLYLLQTHTSNLLW